MYIGRSKMGSYFRDYYSPSATQRATAGDTKFSVINQDHMGWLKCDGRGLSTTAYNILFQVVGYSFGGSGNTFNLPDGRGKVPGAVGITTVNTLNPTTYVLGDVSGNQLHQLTIPEIPAHDHDGVTDLSGTGITTNTNAPATGFVTRSGNNTLTTSDSSAGELDLVNATNLVLTDPLHQHSIQMQGGDLPHNNMQPTIFMGNMFIYSGKYGVGSFPYTANTNIF
jgi:microcystin-dependent protein